MSGLTSQQLEQFGEDGFLVVEDVLSAEDLRAIEAEYEQILDKAAAQLVADGRLQPLAGTSFSERYIEAMSQLDDMYALYQHLDISLPLFDELDHTHTMNAGPAVFSLLTNERLLDIVESVIGPEIYSNPVQHTRIKPPQRVLPDATDANVAATLWHQDAAVVEESADETIMLTVWLAITDATVDNGCLIAEWGSHREDSTLHCPGKIYPAEIYIPDSLINQRRVVPLEVGAGGMILLDKMTEHGSLVNKTENIRWSFDLRYQPPGQPTGREVFPGFLARSKANPDGVLTDAAAWAQLWWGARDRVATGQTEISFGTRWDQYASHQVCA